MKNKYRLIIAIVIMLFAALMCNAQEVKVKDNLLTVTPTEITFPKGEKYTLKIYNDKGYMIMRFKLRKSDMGTFPINTVDEQAGVYLIELYKGYELIAKENLTLE